MKRKGVKKHSIITRILFLLMIVIVMQGIFSFNTIMLTDITTRVESFSYNIFTRTVLNRKANLESFMSTSWSNFSETSTTISERYIEIAGEDGKLTEEEKVVFLRDSVDSVVKMITMAGTTGGFLILNDGEEMQYSYSTVYLKNYDSFNQVVNSDNLMLARGPADISKQYGFSLLPNWSYGIVLNEESYPILSTPIKATEKTKQLEHLAYWHISTDISNENQKVLTCSVPIFDGDNQPIGIIGVEISQEYLYRFLPENEFAEQGSYGYIFADISDTHESLTPLLLNGTEQNNLFSVGKEIPVYELSLQSELLDVQPERLQIDDTNICIYYEPLSIYTNNSPFQNENAIWLVGMVNDANMTNFSSEFWSAIQIMLVVSIGAGLVISYIVGIWVARPILKLSKAVSAHSISQKFDYDTTGIIEIDELSTVIRQMQENILRSAGRTEKILELLNIGVGSFEYEKGAQNVTVSQAIYKMLNIDQHPGGSIPKDLFFEKLSILKSRPIAEVEQTYAVGTVHVQYYKLEEFEQEEVLLGVIEDTTKDVEDLLVLNYERNYDVLTGIFNRRAFHQKVTEVFKNEDLKVAGFVMFDLDNLKYVNDTFGHDNGDVYIKTAATTIYSCLQKYGVVGRMSGDEFYAFLYGFDTKEALLEALNALYAQFEAVPIDMPNAIEFKIRVSGGVAWYGDDSCDLEELKKYADFAMYKGKHTLKGQMRQFEKEQYMEESFMLSGKAELNRILDNEHVNYVFQPIIDVKTGKIHAYEALMRPISDTLGTPYKLLQLAGLEGKLWKIEKIAFFKTLSLYKKYRDMFGDAKLFINSLPSENLLEEEYEELKTVYADCLENVVVEITEQEQQNDNFIDVKLKHLHDLGVNVALDDYGSGYANDIGVIKMHPNIVKIDRSIISNVHVDPSRQTIVHKIIALCKEQNICVLGEGIETEQELEYLMQAGIELAQGYYISRPIELPNYDPVDIEEKVHEIRKMITG